MIFLHHLWKLLSRDTLTQIFYSYRSSVICIIQNSFNANLQSSARLSLYFSMLLSKLTICLLLQPGSLWKRNQSHNRESTLEKSKSYQVESVIAGESAVDLVLPHRKRVGKSRQSLTFVWFWDFADVALIWDLMRSKEDKVQIYRVFF